ncbi:MAG TPA: DoxX family protein [Pseudolabrys sp.]|nr:DoxX family protein [Pseudolabrys sp.]
MSTMTGSGPRLLFPGLAGFYAWAGDVGTLVLRVAVGGILFMHGWGKLQVGVSAVAAGAMAKNGLEPSLLFAYAAVVLETVGAACVVFGLFTRFFAAALAIEMAIAMCFVHWKNGFASGKGGYEYVLLLGTVCFVVALRGGGAYSIDRMIGKEL